MKTTFYLLNNKTCVRLKLYAEDVRHLLTTNNWVEKNTPENTQYVFINTCAFTNKKEDEAIQTIKNYQREFNSSILVILGCLPYINKERLKSFFNGIIIKTRSLDEIINKFELTESITESANLIQTEQRSIYNSFLKKLPIKDQLWTYQFHKDKVFHLKISSGCLSNCTYCAEKFARGKLRSKSIKKIVIEFKQGLKDGYKLFSLNADDTSAFGIDNGENIHDLVSKMLSISKDFHLIITEFNPIGFIRYPKLLALFKSTQIASITIPIQSGSDKILKNMQRGYTREPIVHTLIKIKTINPKLHINSHFIVGFPGETEIDFNKTKEIIKNFDFQKVKIFKYSERSTVDSSKIMPKIPKNIINKRYKSLKKIILFQAIKNFNLTKLFLNINSIGRGLY